MATAKKKVAKKAAGKKRPAPAKKAAKPKSKAPALKVKAGSRGPQGPAGPPGPCDEICAWHVVQTAAQGFDASADAFFPCTG